MTKDIKDKAMLPVLTIAGSDSSGGAGIQADLKTMTAHRAYGMSVICALTAQNTTGVTGILNVPTDFITAQMDAVFGDIPPLATKLGMLSTSDIICTVAEGLKCHRAANIVVDPVMVAESGAKLLADDAAQALIDRLLPMATVITPNLYEAQILSGMSITTRDDMTAAAKVLADLTPAAVLIKGGHLSGDAADLLYHKGEEHWFCAPRIANPNSHGTGCTLSSAIACRLAAGHSIPEAVELAKAYLTDALAANLDLGHGKGPLNHCCRL